MMYGYGRQTERGRQTFGEGRADEQCAGQSRPLRVSDGGKLAERTPALVQHLPQQGNGAPDMVA